MRHIIGDGRTTNMWTDQWLPLHSPRPPRALREINLDTKVYTFLNDTRSGWDVHKLREAVVKDDLKLILELKVSSKAQQDLMGWHYNDNGIYSVKLGYWLATHFPDNNYIIFTHENVCLKHKVWKQKFLLMKQFL